MLQLTKLNEDNDKRPPYFYIDDSWDIQGRLKKHSHPLFSYNIATGICKTTPKLFTWWQGFETWHDYTLDHAKSLMKLDQIFWCHLGGGQTYLDMAALVNMRKIKTHCRGKINAQMGCIWGLIWKLNVKITFRCLIIAVRCPKALTLTVHIRIWGQNQPIS